ncbi:ATP-binding protein [Streptomyces broussonetiae]|uniref:ATP-binding protein n=1 Tax=Streptomyces broussonetiae TaxID=2686304 RepID=UPI0035E11A10
MPQPTTRVRQTGCPGYSETLPREPESAAAARRLVRTACFVWGLDDLSEDGALVVSELVSNAVRHARRDTIRVGIDRTGAGRVCVGVVDFSKTRPVRKSAGPRGRERARPGPRGEAGCDVGNRAAAVGQAGVGGTGRADTGMSARAVIRHETWTREPAAEPTTYAMECVVCGAPSEPAEDSRTAVTGVVRRGPVSSGSPPGPSPTPLRGVLRCPPRRDRAVRR